MNLTEVTLTNLTPHPKNPNTHPAKQIDALGNSLDEFDQVKNVVVWRGHILAGHALIEAALKVGLTTLQAQDVSGWNEDRAVAFMLADIRLPGMAIVDDNLLVEALRVIDEPLDIPGFDEDFLKGVGFIEPELPVDPGPQVDRAEQLRMRWGTETGQIWQIGEHRLAVGDCTDRGVVEGVMGEKRMDAIVTDPPYGIGVNYGSFADDEKTVCELINKFFPIIFDMNAPIALTPGVLSMWYYPRPSWLMVWVHPAPAGSCPWGFAGVNPILVYGDDPYLKNGKGRRPDNISMVADREGIEGHPTPKPIKVWIWLVERLTTGKDQIVFDPFLGSGTTMIAAHQLSRRCYGIELDPGYAAVTLERMKGIGQNGVLTNA